MKKKKEYLLFAGDIRGAGGWRDFIGSSHNIENLREWIDNTCTWAWFQIVDKDKNEMIDYGFRCDYPII